MIQQAIAQVLTPLYDPTFSDSSFGFRPMRSAHDAITVMAEEGRKLGSRCHVVDCDLEKFFDTVDNQKLMGRLRQRITDPGLLDLILKYLKAGAISRQGHFEEQLMGVPQGGPLSPLLANVDSGAPPAPSPLRGTSRSLLSIAPTGLRRYSAR
jgi:retron-type reverse transcriptase